MQRFVGLLLLPPKIFVIFVIATNGGGATSYTLLTPTAAELYANATYMPTREHQLPNYSEKWPELSVVPSSTAPAATLPGLVLFANRQVEATLNEFSKVKATYGTAPEFGSGSEREKRQPFEIVNEWKYLDFEYPSYMERQRAITSGEFMPENNLPLGIDVYGNRLFVTTPRWKDGVPASVGYLPYPPNELSPAIRPYPNWTSHAAIVSGSQPDCRKFVSVYRTSIDACGRLWLIDSGVVNATIRLNQICPPKIVAYDLLNDKQLLSYQLPTEQVKQDSLHSNILADVQNGLCEDAHVYVTDVWRFGLIVYSLAKNRSWRITNYQFNPNPIASDFNVYGLNFQWLDGIFGLSLSAEQKSRNDDRILYFHPMASFKEFAVSTALLRNEYLWSSGQDVAQHFVAIGDRGTYGQSSSAGITRDGVMFYTQVHMDTISCWDTAKPYVRANLVTIVSEDSIGSTANRTHNCISKVTLPSSKPLIQFPNDLKIDQEVRQGVWVISNRLPIYLYDRLNYSEINFRILRADAEHAIVGTVCDPTTSLAYPQKIATLQLYEGQCY